MAAQLRFSKSGLSSLLVGVGGEESDIGETGGADTIQNGKDCGVLDAFVSFDIDASRARRTDACAEFAREFLGCNSLAIEKELSIAKDNNQQGVLSLGPPQRYGITNPGQLRGNAAMEREGHGLKKHEAGGEHRHNRRECGRWNAADGTVRCETSMEHSGGIDSAARIEFPECAYSAAGLR